MIQAKTTEKGFELRNSQQKADLSDSIVEIGQMRVNEPGEYESAGIEIVYGNNAALIVWDKLQIVYVFKNELATTFEKNQFSPCNIVIFSSSITEINKSFFNATLELYDPSVVIVSSKSDINEVSSIIKVEPIESAKISDSALPEEGREFILLS